MEEKLKMKVKYILLCLITFFNRNIIISKEITKEESEKVKNILKESTSIPKEIHDLKSQSKESKEKIKNILHKGGHIKQIKQIVKKPKLNESDIKKIIYHIKEDQKLLKSKMEEFFKSENFYNIMGKKIHKILKESLEKENINLPKEEFENFKNNIMERVRNGEFLPDIDSLVEHQSKEHEEIINKLKEILK